MIRNLDWTASAALLILITTLDALGAQGDEKSQAAAFGARCMGCHAMACNRSGPKLGGIIGRKAATSDFPTYSEALKKSGLTWTKESLDKFLEKPQGLVPGTYMNPVGWSGIESAKERKLLIDFVARGDTSLDNCAPQK